VWAAFVFALLANAWVVDDAYITFRSIENWYAGFGLRWNTFERVQSFTHPLWLLLISGVYGLSGEFFYTTLGLSLGLGVLTVWVIQKRFAATEPWKVFPLIVLLLCSKAFIDYTSSGLENPLTHLLVALFYLTYLPGGRTLRSEAAYCFCIGTLAFVNRIDSSILFLPALVHIGTLVFKSRDRGAMRAILIAGLPALAWLVVATLYFGFPLPNTYYAKAASVGVPSADRLRQGIAYFINSLAWDPPTLLLIGVVIIRVARMRAIRYRIAGVSLVLYLVYVLKVGASGTHMTGRFFSAPYLLSVLVLLFQPMCIRSSMWLCALGGWLSLLCPMSPLKANSGYYRSGGDGSGWGRNGIIDTRFLVQGHDGSALFNFERMKAMPNMPWFDEGLAFRASPERVRVGGHGPAIGFFGFAAGPHKVVIDTAGLSDPLLARLPTDSPDWYGGHFFRRIPEGYEQSVRDQRNQIVDPDLHAYYDKLILATQAPVFGAARLRAIWDLNVGDADSLVRAYVQRTHQARPE
jgi:arabinofuranosyltransferase